MRSRRQRVGFDFKSNKNKKYARNMKKERRWRVVEGIKKECRKGGREWGSENKNQSK